MKKHQTFCQICRHPSPGHEKNCPVLTGEPQAGIDLPSEFLQQLPQGPQNQFMQFGEGVQMGEGQLRQIANMQYAALMTVHDYLVPLLKDQGITVDWEQEAALVQNMLDILAQLRARKRL